MCVFFFSSRRRHTRCRISDWSSDVCSSDLGRPQRSGATHQHRVPARIGRRRAYQRRIAVECDPDETARPVEHPPRARWPKRGDNGAPSAGWYVHAPERIVATRSEEHTSELQSLMRISYAVFFLKKKTYTHVSHRLLPIFSSQLSII